MSECFEKSHCIQTCVWRQFSVVLHAPAGQWSFHPPDPQSPPGPSTEHRAVAMCCVPSSTPSSSWGRAWTCREQDLHMLHANDRGTIYHTSSLYTFIAENFVMRAARALSLISGSCQFLRSLQNIIVKFLRLGFLSWPLTSDSLLTTECCIAENFHEFHGFVSIHKSFLREIWGVAFFGVAKASNPRKFSPRKLYFTNLRKFSPSKVSHYTVFSHKVINPWVHHTLQRFGPKGLSLNT